MPGDSPPGKPSFLRSTMGHVLVVVTLLAGVATIAAFIMDLDRTDTDSASRDGDRRASTPATEERNGPRRTPTPTPKAGPRVTVASWAGAMAQVCGSMKAAAAARGPSPRDYDGAIQYLNQTASEWRQMQAAARDVPVPASAREQIREMLMLWDEAGDNFSQMAIDVANNDEPSFNTHRATGQTLARSGSEIAVSLGASECEGVS